MSSSPSNLTRFWINVHNTTIQNRSKHGIAFDVRFGDNYLLISGRYSTDFVPTSRHLDKDMVFCFRLHINQKHVAKTLQTYRKYCYRTFKKRTLVYQFPIFIRVWASLECVCMSFEYFLIFFLCGGHLWRYRCFYVLVRFLGRSFAVFGEQLIPNQHAQAWEYMLSICSRI